MRAEITACLDGARAPTRSAVAQDGPVLPNVVPITERRTICRPAYADGGALADREALSSSSREVRKTYPTPKGPLTVVDGFNLKMKKGEFVTLIGHSGCGKSTVLSMAAGLNQISSGGIVLDGREVDGAGPDRAVVFQSPSLMPWLTARENVALGVDRVYPKASPGRAARHRRILSAAASASATPCTGAPPSSPTA